MNSNGSREINDTIILLMIGLYCLAGGSACEPSRNKNEQRTTVDIEVENAYNQTVYVENIPSAGMRPIVLDSLQVKERIEKMIVKIPEGEEGLYVIKVKNSGFNFVFVNDKPVLRIHVDFFSPDNNRAEGSPATSSLNSFLQSQAGLVKQNAPKLNSTGKTFTTSPYALSTMANRYLIELQERYRNYVDTVSSPAAALYFINNLDFGKDHAALKLFSTRLAERFASHKGIQSWYADVLRFVSIFEQELNIGDKMPGLSLPDSTGQIIGLDSFPNKYLFIDLWASWCGPCRAQSIYKMKAHQEFGTDKLQMVSISLDPERSEWINAIREEHYGWLQLRDSLVWNGRTVDAYKFDSIPFNYLVAPGGRIVGKALYGDSLLSAIRRFLN